MESNGYPLPDYLQQAKPNPQENRAPWYMNTAPSYAGIFLWIAFYDQLAPTTLGVGGIAAAVLGLFIAAFISFGLFYLVPALWGMKTGYPLYIVGTSTFGDKGGYFLPGLFMGALQVGWYSVGTYYATQFILNAMYGVANAPQPRSLMFIIFGIIWGYVFAFVGVKGINYVAKISQFLPIVPLVMLIYALFSGMGGISKFDVANFTDTPSFGLGTLVMIQLVIGFFATAGAAGADFGMNNRDKNDVIMGGLVGVAVSIFICGLLPILAIAGVMANNPELANAETGAWTFGQAIGAMTGGQLMFLLFAIASMAPACFCSFIIANSFSTMIPSISRMAWTMGGATIGIILAVTGIAGQLAGFFGFIGACFGPVCGAMAADYILCGGQWPGPRKGINMAGYIAVIVGFIVGILPNLGVGGFIPAAVYSFIVGFVLYMILAKAGLQPETISLSAEKATE
ncbi:MAG: cytosine permease [Candidatus Omnitrophota bacterium]|jgi:cytosine permease|nr:MAG: cytosine permease [Candidatus Omnitrophota bacterium]